MLDRAKLLVTLRLARRYELIHYVAAAHRDTFAWNVCQEYLADPLAPLAVLKQRAREHD